MIDVDATKCICKGSGFYYEYIPTQMPYQISDTDLLDVYTPETVKKVCPYHAYWYQPTQNWLYRWLKEPTAPTPPKPKANIKYPDGWPEEDLRAWCKAENVPEPDWMPKETYQGKPYSCSWANFNFSNNPDSSAGGMEQSIESLWVTKSGHGTKIPEAEETLYWLAPAGLFKK